MPIPEWKYTDEIGEIICGRLAEGESIRTICKDPDLPSHPTIFKWLDKHPEFAARYARARTLQADKLFDEIEAIADSQEGDVIIVDGKEMVNYDAIARAKLRIDTRKWMAGKLRPSKYGEKLEVEHAGKIMLTPTISFGEKDAD